MQSKACTPPTTFGLVSSILAVIIAIAMFVLVVYYAPETLRNDQSAPTIESKEVEAVAREFFREHAAIPKQFGISKIRNVQVRCGYRPATPTDTVPATPFGIPQCTAQLTVLEAFTTERPLCVTEEDDTMLYEAVQHGACTSYTAAERQYIHTPRAGIFTERAVWLTFTKQADGWEHEPFVMHRYQKSGLLQEATT